MSGADFAAATLGRVVASFHPRSMPALSRAHYRRELAAWAFLPIMVGAVEGGVASLLAKNVFAGAVPTNALNFAVAVLAGAPAFANVSSFLWASLSHGRHKIRFIVGLQLAAAASVALVGFAPRSTGGLLLATVGVVCARTCWSGVVTLRSTVWRANYPRTARARIAGRLAIIQSLVITSVGAVIGLLMDLDDRAFHLLYPAAAVLGVVGIPIYRRLRMRGHRAILAGELARPSNERPGLHPGFLARLVLRDRAFGSFMLCQFVFGIGNMMVTAPLVIMLRDDFHAGYLTGILVTASIPMLVMALTIPLWSRMLDNVHIVHFRAYHSWAFVAIGLVLLVASFVPRSIGLPLLFAAATARGVAFGGGVLAWNLGHHDFAKDHNASEYMGVHVTLTGIRGLVAPITGVGIYTLLERLQPGLGGGVFAVAVAVSSTGAIGFVAMHRRMRRDILAGSRHGTGSTPRPATVEVLPDPAEPGRWPTGTVPEERPTEPQPSRCVAAARDTSGRFNG